MIHYLCPFNYARLYSTSTFTEQASKRGRKAYARFYNVVGKKIGSISSYPDEREFLIPPTQIQWVEAVQGDRNMFYFTGRCVNSPEFAKDTQYVEAYNGISSLQESYRSIKSKQEALAQQVDELHDKTDWRESVLGLLKKDLQKLAETKVLVTEIKSLKDNVSEILERAKLLRRIEEVLDDVRKMALYKFYNEIFLFKSRQKLSEEHEVLVSAMLDEADRLMQKYYLSQDDLIKMKERFDAFGGFEEIPPAIIGYLEELENNLQTKQQKLRWSPLSRHFF